MKAISSTLLTYLNAFRPTSDAALCMADLYTFTLASGSAAGIASGTVLTFTSFDEPVLWNGYTYSANSLQVSGLKYKCTTGVNVDQQKITLSDWPNDLIGGVSYLQAIQHGMLDGAEVQRERAFFYGTGPGYPPPLTPIGAIILFKGRVTTVDKAGRTTAEVTIASDLTLLDINMPRNVYQPNCVHTLYDSGCGISRAACTSSGVVGAGSTYSTIVWPGATANFQQGTITFTSGVNSSVEATVKTATAGLLTLAYPLLNVPGAGDTFTASWGCDHTQATCQAKFANEANFRGFPFVPPPQIITGPLSSTYSTGGK